MAVDAIGCETTQPSNEQMNIAIHTETREQEARLGWLALVLTPQMGPTRSARAVQRLGGAERVFTASLTELEGAGLPAEAAQFCFDGRAREAALKEAAHTAEQQAGYLTPEDEAYPQRLLEIYDPPPVLWVRGNLALLNRAAIAVVGTRQPTPYGSGMAEVISRDLARRGMVVMSGMARGVDTCAHKGALDAGGATGGCVGHGHRRDLSQGEQEARRADRRTGRSDCERVSTGDVSGAAELSHPQPHAQRHERRRTGGGGGGVLRHAHHRALRSGAGARRVCSARQRDQQKRVGAEHVD